MPHHYHRDDNNDDIETLDSSMSLLPSLCSSVNLEFCKSLFNVRLFVLSKVTFDNRCCSIVFNSTTKSLSSSLTFEYGVGGGGGDTGAGAGAGGNNNDSNDVDGDIEYT
ncbi:hypothetical protein DERP_006875 [Dermatophagoides pteronyssinus]|uniref:Uncharacterized protein n=1 Tax=Dermatophagoides pteronyssinus TaxID=6956 RepID=A0ABQ8IS95_DERPT|nr:hypothetical protein DERP_006875 [Dermatophagoides pteronyssinus]